MNLNRENRHYCMVFGVAEDSPHKGIPPGNLKSLKEFLAVRRGTESVKPYVSRLPKELHALPLKMQRTLLRFIEEVRTAQYLDAHGPAPAMTNLCGLYEGDTWLKAKEKAKTIAGDAEKEGREKAKLSNETLMAAMKAANGASRFTAITAIIPFMNGLAEGVLPDLNHNDYLSRDLALMASMLLVSDLEFEGKERFTAHAKLRWDIWKCGYAVACDTDGQLHIYYSKGPRR